MSAMAVLEARVVELEAALVTYQKGFAREVDIVHDLKKCICEKEACLARKAAADSQLKEARLALTLIANMPEYVPDSGGAIWRMRNTAQKALANIK